MTTPTEQKLQTLVADKLRVAPENVALDAKLLEELGLDSFDLMGVVLEIEELFPGVELSDKSAEELSTLREVATYVDQSLAAKS